MPNKSREMLIPQYMHTFACIGSTCEDTCCAGWDIHVDKATYKKYNKIGDRELKKKITEGIQRVRDKEKAERGIYARIKLNEHNQCPFLNEEKLCSIQLKQGETYLSTTCSTYPRTNNVIEGRLEQSTSLSCPEAARLALLNPKKMEFDEITLSAPPKGINKVLSPKSNEGIQSYFWSLRIFSIQLLQNREFTLAERLIILGLFFEKIQLLEQEGKLEQIATTIQQFEALISEKQILKQELNAIPTKTDIQINLIKDLILTKRNNIRSIRFQECMNDFVQGLHFEGKVDEGGLVETYQKAFESYYKPYMDKHEYILENYLVNYVFRNLFPFYRGEKVFEDYIMLVVHYAMIKLLLIGISNHYKGLDEKVIIKLIQSFAKTVEHSSTYLDVVLQFLNERELTSMAYMAILIKN